MGRHRRLARARHVHHLALLALLVTIVPVMLAPIAHAQTDSGTFIWGQPFNVTADNSLRSVFPWADLDGNDNVHLVNEINAGADSAAATAAIAYRNNAGGQLNAPVNLVSGLKTDTNPYFAIAVDGNNGLHLVYSAVGGDRDVHYRRGTLGANGAVTWGSPIRITQDQRTFDANLAISPVDNSVHVTWIDQRNSSTYQVEHLAISASGVVGAAEQVKGDGVYQDRPRIAVTNDGKVHITYERGTSSSADIWYSRRELDGRWVSQNISSSSGTGSFSPTITTNGSNGIYIAWDENVNGHDVVFRRSNDGGQNFSNRVTFSGTSAFASYPFAAYSATNNRVYVVWEDATGGSGTADTDIWMREFNPANDATSSAVRLNRQTSPSNLPMIAVGKSRAFIFWSDRSTGQRQIFGVSSVTEQGTGCTGTLVLEAGAISTTKTTLQGTITPVTGCTPTQMQISVDTTVTDNTPIVSYNPNISVAMPDLATCSRQVYVRLIGPNGPGTTFGDSIVLDARVDATASAVNPSMRGLPIIYTPPGLLDTRDNGGASDGDQSFTRDRTFMLTVNDTGDCSGINTVRVGAGVAMSVGTAGLVTPQGLPGDRVPGAKLVPITITDKATSPGNSMTVTRTIVFDPANTDTTGVQPNVDGLPKLASGGSVTDANPQNSIMRTLQFNGISVTDNLYGKVAGIQPQLADGKQFWGVWVANSRTAINDPVIDAEGTFLQWTPIYISNPGSSFSIPWSVFAGLNYNPLDASKTGDYYVYVRFLDGAGNGSREFLSTKVTLTSGFSVPTVSLPVVRR